jgi:DNA-binding PadR family transcriptional regulator
MTGRELTTFEHILLGLICMSPASGYDLKRIFAVTPMGIYQPSSGTLYPALHRLQLRGLIQAQGPFGPDGESARHRRVYEPTPAGRAAHVDWLRTPVDPATVGRDLGLHLMRFVMMEHLFPRDEVVAFLRRLADALAAFTSEMERYRAAADQGDLSDGADPGDRFPRLALDHGLAVHRTSLRWVRHTIAVLSGERSST